MNTETKTDFLTDLKQQIKDKLQDYKGGTHYTCDLAYTLFEGENVNGSVFCNTYKTVEFIKENFELFGELVEHVKENMDMTLNPFTEPEKAHVILLLETAQSVLSECEYIEENWNEQIELTDDVIKKISEQVDAFDSDFF